MLNDSSNYVLREKDRALIRPYFGKVEFFSCRMRIYYLIYMRDIFTLIGRAESENFLLFTARHTPSLSSVVQTDFIFFAYT